VLLFSSQVNNKIIFFVLKGKTVSKTNPSTRETLVPVERNFYWNTTGPCAFFVSKSFTCERENTHFSAAIVRRDKESLFPET